ncbi:MAG: hypothetical protein NC102_03090 [Clostridium sp.]|nr:hypothetical protein [Clostridium sp.]
MNNEKVPHAPERIYDNWAKRNVYFETELEESVIRQIADYGSGATKLNTSRGYSLGGGYEVYILAFFLGLYSNKRRPIEGEKKTFGQAIQYWGNLDSRGERKAYSRLRDFIFAAAVAKTDIDLLAVERGEIPLSNAISALIKTMDEYANYGFHLILDKLEEDKHYFTSNSSFLSIFMPLFKEINGSQENNDGENNEDGPDSLD